MFLNLFLKNSSNICNLLHRKTIRVFDNFSKKGHEQLLTIKGYLTTHPVHTVPILYNFIFVQKWCRKCLRIF